MRPGVVKLANTNLTVRRYIPEDKLQQEVFSCKNSQKRRSCRMLSWWSLTFPVYRSRGAGHWCPLSYLFYNLIFFLILLWAIHHREGDEPMQMAVAVSAVSIILDMIVLSLYFPGSYTGSERFSAGMAILNLILRPFTTLILYRVYVERAGAVGAPLPALFGVNRAERSPYEDIDNALHQSVPHTDIPSPSQNPFGSKMPPPYHT